MTPLGSDPWMPNGFPPPSFVVETERTGRFSQVLSGPRNRWLAAAALLGAVLLLAGILLIANRGDDDDTALRSDQTSSTFGAVSDTTATSVLDPTASLPDAGTAPPGDPGAAVPTVPGAPGGGGGGGGTTVPPAPGAPTPPAPGATPAKLEATPSTLAIPKVDASVGPQSAKLGLRNTGGTALSYTSRSNTGALSIDPPSGSMPAGAATEVTIILDGNKAGEGGFTGVISIDGSGGSQPVTVTSTVGRPPDISDAGQNCPPERTDCSSQIQIAPSSPGQTSPCNSPWFFRVNVSDESQLKTVRVNANVGEFGGGLLNNGATSGPPGVWSSRQFRSLNRGEVLTFTVEAIDQFDYARKASERTVRCP